jgi:ribonuclease HII
LLAGIDEVGRGPLAGPVVAAAVILDDLRPIKGLRDSKALGPVTRVRLAAEIRAKALCVSVAQASVEEIDRLNILQATLLAMQRAVQGLRLLPKLALVDGNRLPVLVVPAEANSTSDTRATRGAACASARKAGCAHAASLTNACSGTRPRASKPAHRCSPSSQTSPALRYAVPLRCSRRSRSNSGLSRAVIAVTASVTAMSSPRQR